MNYEQITIKVLSFMVIDWEDRHMKLFNQTFHVLERGLDYSTAKNRTISNNIANVDTPLFKSQDVVFKDVLNSEMSKQFKAKRTHEKHIDFSKTAHLPYSIITNRHTAYNHNGNNVDIDKEMAELAKNQIYYQSLVERMNGKFGTLQTVIRGGR